MKTILINRCAHIHWKSKEMIVRAVVVIVATAAAAAAAACIVDVTLLLCVNIC
jgi:hypothetical protein